LDHRLEVMFQRLHRVSLASQITVTLVAVVALLTIYGALL